MSTRPTKPHRCRELGFNLIEMMIAITLGLIVILGASNVFLSNKQSYRTNTALSQIQEGSRIAVELLSRDLRQARLTGCGNQGTVANQIRTSGSPAALPWYADFANRGLRGFDGSTADSNPALTTGTSPGNHLTGTDNITLIGASDVAYSLSSHTAGTYKLTLNEANSELGIGDLIVICDTAQADIAQITSTTGGFVIAPAAVTAATPGNNAAPSKTYFRNAQISRLKSSTWYIGCNPVTALNCDPLLGGTSLYRLTVSGAAGPAVATQAQEMVRGVAAMDLTFVNPATSNYVEAEGIPAATWPLSTIPAVRISLSLVARDSAPSNTLISRVVTTTVSLRNPPI